LTITYPYDTDQRGLACVQAVAFRRNPLSYPRALMLTHQGCPQTPGGRIRALGFARMGARGRRRGPIPAVYHRYSSPLSYPRALMLTHQGCPQTPGGRIRALGFARMGARGRRRGPIPAVYHRYSSPLSYPRALMLTHQGCPQTPGGRMGARGRRRGPIPAMCQYQGSPLSNLGYAGGLRWAPRSAYKKLPRRNLGLRTANQRAMP